MRSALSGGALTRPPNNVVGLLKGDDRVAGSERSDGPEQRAFGPEAPQGGASAVVLDPTPSTLRPGCSGLWRHHRISGLRSRPDDRSMRRPHDPRTGNDWRRPTWRGNWHPRQCSRLSLHSRSGHLRVPVRSRRLLCRSHLGGAQSLIDLAFCNGHARSRPGVAQDFLGDKRVGRREDAEMGCAWHENEVQQRIFRDARHRVKIAHVAAAPRAFYGENRCSNRLQPGSR
jgi:hypothetical protein